MSRRNTMRSNTAATVGVCALLLVTLAPVSAAGQRGVASVSGTIEDPRGAVLPGVQVTLTSESGALRTATTLSDGTFRFENLAEGRYDLDMTHRGFNDARSDVVVGGGHTIAPTVTMRIGGVEEFIRIPMKPFTSSRTLPRAQRQEQCGKGLGCVQSPVKTVDVRPQYPNAARADGIQGLVVVEAIINAQGLVEEIKPLASPDRDLVDATVAAVRQWQFSPALLNGVPIDCVLNVTAEFVETDR